VTAFAGVAAFRYNQPDIFLKRAFSAKENKYYSFYSVCSTAKKKRNAGALRF